MGHSRALMQEPCNHRRLKRTADPASGSQEPLPHHDLRSRDSQVGLSIDRQVHGYSLFFIIYSEEDGQSNQLEQSPSEIHRR